MKTSTTTMATTSALLRPENQRHQPDIPDIPWLKGFQQSETWLWNVGKPADTL